MPPFPEQFLADSLASLDRAVTQDLSRR
jgi:hypothetical protein